MKTFYSAEDIQNFADQGRREICIDSNVVLTDLAKQTAHMLGVRITEKTSGPSHGSFTPTRPQPAAKAQVVGAKPKGCQRRPPKTTVATPGPSRPVVDKLVEKIKRINDQSS
jgi:hypothetical protein